MNPLYLRTVPAAIAALFLLPVGIVRAQAPTWAWGVSLGTPDVESVNAIASDATGNVYATGTFLGLIDLDPGPGNAPFSAVGTDPFILKMDDAGALVWARTLTGANHQFAQCIAVDPAGNVYVAGQIGPNTVDMDPGSGTFNLNAVGSYDLFVLKLDNAGDFVWAKAMGGTSDEAPFKMTVDASGHVYVCGRFLSTNADFDPGAGMHLLGTNSGWDAFVVELDTDGNFAWANSMGADGTWIDEASGIAVDDDGNVFVTGAFADTVDFDPGPGVQSIAAVEFQDAFVTKYTTDGDLVWARAIGGTSTQRITGLALDADANILLTGSYPSGTDFDSNAGVVAPFAWPNDLYVLKLDSASNFQWVRTTGEGTFQYSRGQAISTDVDGNVYMAGWYDGTMDADPGPDTLTLTSAGDEDVLLMKLDAAGTLQWVTTAQESATDMPSAMALGNTGSLYVAANYASEDLTLGVTVNNAGGTSGTTDMLIARLDSTDLATGLVAMDPARTEVMAFPYPFDAQVNVSGTTANDELRLLDMSGRFVLRARAQAGATTLNTSPLLPGVYILELRRGNASMRSKVVKR